MVCAQPEKQAGFSVQTLGFLRIFLVVIIDHLSEVNSMTTRILPSLTACSQPGKFNFEVSYEPKRKYNNEDERKGKRWKKI